METSPSAPLPRRCWWGFHRWTVWGAPVAYQCHIESLALKRKSDPFIEHYQSRACLLCHKQEERTAR